MENILVVRVKDELFGIESERVGHILKPPAFTPLPLSSEKVRGVCVILGKVFTALDLGVILHGEKLEIKETSRVLTIGESVFLVDEVKEIIEFNEENFEKAEEKYILGFYKDKEVIQILDIDEILKENEKFNYKKNRIEKIENKLEENKKISQTQRYLFFTISNEKFAIDINLIKEIIYVPEIVPSVEKDILGVINLRGVVISVISLAEELGYEKRITPQSRCIIAQFEKRLIALLVDSVEKEEDVEIEEIERFEGFDKIEGVYKKEIVSILKNEFIKELIRKYAVNQVNEEEKVRNEKMRELVVFKIKNEEYAFNIDEVQEVIKYEKLTSLPKSNEIVEGLLNLRGNVLPIVSLPKRLGFEFEPNEDNKIIVCDIKGNKVGFIVDDVNDILFIDEAHISKIESEEKIFDEVINLNDRVILKIDVNKIFNDDEIKILKEIDE